MNRTHAIQPRRDYRQEILDDFVSEAKRKRQRRADKVREETAKIGAAARQQYNFGLEAKAKGNMPRAIKWFRVAAYSNCPEALFELGKIYYQKRDLEVAKRLLDRSAKLGNHDAIEFIAKHLKALS